MCRTLHQAERLSQAGGWKRAPLSAAFLLSRHQGIQGIVRPVADEVDGEHGDEGSPARIVQVVHAGRDTLGAAAGRGHGGEEPSLGEVRGGDHLGGTEHTGAHGMRACAARHFTSATTMYREMDMRFWLEQAAAEMKNSAFVIAPTT